jgi:hypothetical protein
MRSNLRFGGARPTLFDVQFLNSGVGQVPDISRFMCQATDIPSSQMGFIEVPYFGRKIKYAGDRTFIDWTVTILNDEAFDIRHAMERWSNALNSHENNLRLAQQGGETQGYKANAIVRQYGKTGPGDVLRAYRFNGIFPIDVSTIPLDWNSTDTIEQFTVTFAYDYWEIADGGRAGTLSV